MKSAIDIYKQGQGDYSKSKIDNLQTDFSIPMPSEWAAENRYITEGESPENFGQFDPTLVPHKVQILNDLHPDSPYKIITDMKSVQSASTTSILENGIGFCIRYRLGSILMLTSTKSMASIRGSGNIDVMIDNSNLAELIRPASDRNKKNNKDGALYKEFAGGHKLVLSSYNSVADLKTNPYMYIFKDELDEAKAELKDLGDIEALIEGRTRGVRGYKIVNVSTSSRAETSRINKNFLLGDQNEYFMPCPVCGELQILGLKRKGDKGGLTFTRETDRNTGQKILINDTVRYTCKHCEKDFREGKKLWMLQNGEWRAQVIPKDPLHRSYHESGLISPFLPWQRICSDFIKCDFGQDILEFKNFTIDVLGLPWMNIKKTAKWEMLKNRAEDYILGTVPSGEEVMVSGMLCYTGPLFLAAGADVQGDRLECEVVGFGLNGEKWLVDTRVFYGNTASLDDPCWEALSDFIYSQSYKIVGNDILISCCGLDAGWNPRKGVKRNKDFSGKAHIVYEFVSSRTDKFMATMGSPDDKAIGIIKSSKINDTNTSLSTRYMISVSLLKEVIMGVIENTEGHNTIHVPDKMLVDGEVFPMSDELYEQFLSERYQENPKKPGEYAWIKTRNRNEILDMFIYAIGAAERYGVSTWTRETWSKYYLSLIG